MKDKFLPLSLILTTAFVLSACIATTSVRQGSLENNVYRSSTDEFSLSIPAGAAVHDGVHPLGGFVSLKKLPEPARERGLAYYRVVQPDREMTVKEAEGIIEASYKDWLQNYAGRTAEHVLHAEWMDVDGATAYFTVIEGASSGFLVKPGAYYGALGFARGNYSYVIYEIITAPYQLKGSPDTPETLGIKNPENRIASLLNYLDTVNFSQAATVKDPMN